jgi:hypothetical protein
MVDQGADGLLSELAMAPRRKPPVPPIVLPAFVMMIAWLATARADDLLDRGVRFHISASPLASALIEFSTQSGIQVAAADADVAHLNSNGVNGTLPIGAALSTLLRSTGLEFSRVGRLRKYPSDRRLLAGVSARIVAPRWQRDDYRAGVQKHYTVHDGGVRGKDAGKSGAEDNSKSEVNRDATLPGAPDRGCARGPPSLRRRALPARRAFSLPGSLARDKLPRRSRKPHYSLNAPETRVDRVAGRSWMPRPNFQGSLLAAF